MSTATIPMRRVEHPDGSHSIECGDITFGPYGPGQCPETYGPGGIQCRHGRNHGGCHTADMPIPPGRKVTKHVEAEFTIRWGTGNPSFATTTGKDFR